MKKNHYLLLIAALSFTLVGCSSNDDDDAGSATDGAATDGAATDGAATDGAATDGASTDGSTTAGEAVSYQVTVTNLTTGQLMTPPVAAIHDDSANLFEIGQPASDAIRDIAEMGSNDALVAFAGDNPTLISASALVGSEPIGPGAESTATLSSAEADHVFSLVNMVICTNDGISGVDSTALPTGTEPVTINAMAYDAGTRVNQADNNTFIPAPCREDGVDVTDAPLEDPRVAIAAHPGQTNIPVPASRTAGDWDIAPGAEVLRIVITRN